MEMNLVEIWAGMSALVRTVVVRAAELPPADDLAPWLDRTWSLVDAWVAGHVTR